MNFVFFCSFWNYLKGISRMPQVTWFVTSRSHTGVLFLSIHKLLLWVLRPLLSPQKLFQNVQLSSQAALSFPQDAAEWTQTATGQRGDQLQQATDAGRRKWRWRQRGESAPARGGSGADSCTDPSHSPLPGRQLCHRQGSSPQPELSYLLLIYENAHKIIMVN